MPLPLRASPSIENTTCPGGTPIVARFLAASLVTYLARRMQREVENVVQLKSPPQFLAECFGENNDARQECATSRRASACLAVSGSR